MNVVAVTGGTGLLGQELTPRLRARGLAVRLLSRNPPVAPPTDPGVTFIQGSLLDEAALDQLVDGADCIVHAAYAEPGEAGRDGRSATQVWLDENFLGTARLLERTARTRARQLLYASSLAVFSRDPNLDPRGDGLRRDEECALLPLEFYGSLKAACEQLVRTSAFAYGFNASVWRLGCILGVRTPWTTSPMAGCVREAVASGEVRTAYGAYALSAGDAAAALADAVGDPGVRGEVYHVFDRWLDHHDLAQAATKALGRPIAAAAPRSPEPRSPILGDKMRKRMAQRGLHWQTEAHLIDIVTAMIRRMREDGAPGC